jgi:hyperosmotically inducible protein
MTTRFLNRFVAPIAALAISAAVSLPMHAQTSGPNNDAAIQADVQKALKNKAFSDVQINTSGGIVTLTGSVKVYADKEYADSKVHHVKQAIAVRNEIKIEGPTVPDDVLYKKLSDKISWDRIGYGTTPFNAIEIHVQNGVVTLTGHAYGPVDKDSAVALVEYYPGVKDVVDDVQVDPVSDFDDQSRRAEYRAIYGFPSLSRYGSDPAKPIRITVINGTVILSGTVDSEADKNVATLRANQVPGVFKVVNNLAVVPYKSNKKPAEPKTDNSTTVSKN